MTQHISTKTGDDGTSGLFDGKRYPKTDIIYELLGTLDEVSASIGVAKIKIKDQNYLKQLEEIQQDLLDMGSHFASLNVKKVFEFDVMKLSILEDHLREIENALPALRQFILPGGTNGGAELHLARAVARRAERIYFIVRKEKNHVNMFPGKYLNRLSDYLFQLARLVEMNQD